MHELHASVLKQLDLPPHLPRSAPGFGVAQSAPGLCLECPVALKAPHPLRLGIHTAKTLKQAGLMPGANSATEDTDPIPRIQVNLCIKSVSGRHITWVASYTNYKTPISQRLTRVCLQNQVNLGLKRFSTPRNVKIVRNIMILLIKMGFFTY